MATSLENQYIDESYQKLVQIEGTALSDGTGSAVTELNITAANATAAVSASHAIKADSATSASYAASATLPGGIVSSSAQISDVTASLVETASSALNVLTFTKGDGTTFNVTVDTGSASVEDWDSLAGKPNGLVSGSTQITDLGFVQSAITASSVITGSVNGSNLTFTKGDGTTFDLLVTAPPSISASYAETATSASWAQRAYFAETVEWTGINNKPTVVSGSGQIDVSLTTGNLDGGRVSGTVANATNATSASYAVSATLALSASHANNADSSLTSNTSISSSHALVADTSISSQTAVSASHALNADNAIASQTAVSASHALIADTALTAATATLATSAQNTIVTGKNVSGAPIPKGTPLYFTGSGTGGNLVGVYPADASNPNRMPAGGIAGVALAIEEEGIILLDGFINAVDTSLFGSGDQIWVKAGGGYTNTRPTGSTTLIQPLGYVEKSAVNGSGVIQGPGVPVALPNIDTGNFWVGNGNGVAQSISTGSFAKTDKNNSFTGTQTFDNISVNGTGSFAYIQSVTGSAKVIGDAFLILNNDTPAERYAGIKVIDSGSVTATTASLQFDGQTNDWFYEYESDATDFGVVMFGPEYATKGSPTYNTANTILKADGGHHLLDSSITDTGALVTISNPLTVTGTISGNVTGNLTGTATAATSASHALLADNATTAVTATNSTQLNGQAASFYLDASNINAGTIADAYLPASISSDITGNAATATTAISASYAPFSTGSITDQEITWTQAQSFSSRVRGNVLTPSSANNATTVNLANGSFFSITTTEDTTISALNTAPVGWGQTVSVAINNQANHTVSFAAAIKWSGGTAPTISNIGITIITFVTIDNVVYGTAVENLS